jgi:hypothetical protein
MKPKAWRIASLSVNLTSIILFLTHSNISRNPGASGDSVPLSSFLGISLPPGLHGCRELKLNEA